MCIILCEIEEKTEFLISDFEIKKNTNFEQILNFTRKSEETDFKKVVNSFLVVKL